MLNNNSDHSGPVAQSVGPDSSPENSSPPAQYAFRDRHGRGFLQIRGRPTVYSLDAPATKYVVLQEFNQAGVDLRPSELRERLEQLHAAAQLNPKVEEVWNRVAPIAGGVVIDIGTPDDTRIRVTSEGVELVTEGTGPLFCRTQATAPFVLPDGQGDLSKLDRYLNLNAQDVVLLKAWLSYTLAHPKAEDSKFPILILWGEQGSGKSFLGRRIQDLIDPSHFGIQTMPKEARDLAIIVQQSHVCVFDNIRSFRPAMADNLCVTATGGVRTTRRLFKDGELYIARLHGALVLNGIHSFIDQPDLAQRCLPITMLPMDEGRLESEKQLIREFKADLPKLVRGLLDLTVSILKCLPSIRVLHKERMIDFVEWLAAMERIDGKPEGAYQAAYGKALNRVMFDSLLDDPVAVSVMKLVDAQGDIPWNGTPSELFVALQRLESRNTSNRGTWPPTVNAMSKRLTAMQAALRRQGIEIRKKHSKQRQFQISRRAGVFTTEGG